MVAKEDAVDHFEADVWARSREGTSGRKLWATGAEAHGKAIRGEGGVMRTFAILGILFSFWAGPGCGADATPFSQNQPMSVQQRLESLKQIVIEGGKIVSADHDDSPEVVHPNGQTQNNVPPRTVVKLVFTPAKGSESNVEIWLPDPEKWNGRFLGLGNGGAAGSINSASFVGPLSGGYAVATTDMGTAHSGVGNPEVWKDFGFRATHLMTVAAKQAIKAYYGEDPKYSYFSGASTGGQQGLQEAQRYPGDYDGIVAGIPAHCRAPLHAYFLWNDQILNRCPFTQSQQDNIVAAGIEYMAPRQIPALAGKAVADPRCSREDVEKVIRLAMQKDPTLTKKHEKALRQLFDGPKHAVNGERIFGGIPIGSPFNIAHGHLYLFKWVLGENKNLALINFGKDIDTYMAALGPHLNAENPDLRPFKDRGGKMIMYSGASDSCVPFHATLDYYELVAQRLGGIDAVRSFFNYYIVPGLAHGSGPVINSLPNMLALVVDWREKGIAPEAIRVKRIADGKTEIDIPVYPYPTQTSWDAKASDFKPVEGPRGNVERVAERFRK